MTTKEKIREIIESYDCLTTFCGGTEHCIVPEMYDELADELYQLFLELYETP